MQLRELAAYTDRLLEIDRFSDYCPNGLQVEGRREIRTLIGGVTACQALLDAATSGDARFFLGTDSAPHARGDKEADCGCAGCYTGLHALELYATAFEAAGRLQRLEGFASHFGADFYRLPRNTGTLTLCKQDWAIPNALPYGERTLVPLAQGETLGWRMLD